MTIGKYKFDLLAIITGFLLFIAMRPFWIWDFSKYLMMLVLILPILPMIIRNDMKAHRAAFAVFLIILLMNDFIRGYGILYAIYNTVLVFVPFCKRQFAANAFDVFRKILAICFAISIVEWFMVFAGYDLPSFNINPLNELKPYDYTAYPPLLVVSNKFLEYFRFLSSFDEPGVVGTISLIILYIENFNLKNFYNVIIFVAGISSFSLFFYVGSILYVGIKYGIRRPAYIVGFFFAIAAFYLFTKDNPVLDELVYSRFEWDESKGSFVGDNRSNDKLDPYYESIRGSWGYFWGFDEKVYTQYGETSTYKVAVLQYGMVFCVAYVFFFMAFAWKRGLNRNDFYLFCTLIVSTLYQRPGFFDVVYVFAFAHFINVHEGSRRVETQDLKKCIPHSSITVSDGK